RSRRAPALPAAASGRAGPRRTPTRPRRARDRARRSRASCVAIQIVQLALQPAAELILAREPARRRRRWLAQPPSDHDRHTNATAKNGRERRHPREPVEPAERRRRQHLLAVARAERAD